MSKTHTTSPLQSAIDYLEAKGHEVRFANGKYFVRNSQGQPLTPNGMSAKSVVALAEHNKSYDQPKKGIWQ